MVYEPGAPCPTNPNQRIEMIIASLLALMSPGFVAILWAFFAIEDADEMLKSMLVGVNWIAFVGLFFAIAATIS